MAVVGTAAVAAGVAIAKVTADAVRVATDFESQMSILAIAAKESGLEFAGLEKAALQVGGDISLVGVSASGAADAMTGLYKAGLTTAEIFGDLDGYMSGTTKLGGALRAAIDLAAASELDMVAASDLAAITLATFGGELKTAEERAKFVEFAMNNLVKAADASVADVSDLAGAMQMVGPSAVQMGIGLADVNTALALMSGAGIKGTRAGSNLDAMLRSLSDPTDKAQDSLDALGVTLFDAEGNFKALPTIVGEMQSALKGMTAEEKSAALGAIFTAQGQRAMNVLLNEGTQGWTEMTAAIADATGISEQAAAKANTLAGAQEAFAGALETLKITAAKELLPILTDLTRWAAEMITKYGPPLVAFVGRLIEGFRSVAGAISGLASGETNLADMLPPGVLKLWEALQKHWDTMGAWWATNGPAIMESARKMGVMFKDTFEKLAADILPWLVEKMAEFGAWWTDNGPLIVTFVDNIAKAFAVMMIALRVAWTLMKPILDLLIGYILNIATLIMQVATGDWAGAWQTMKDIVSDAWTFIVDTISAAIESIIKGIDILVRKFTGISLPKWMGGSGSSPTEESTSVAPIEGVADTGPVGVIGGWQAGAGATTTNNFNMAVNTQATSPAVQNDYRMMQARIGSR